MTMIGDKTRQTARKTHRCWWCGCGIQPGEEYIKWIWKERYEYVPIHVHADCHEVWQDLQPDEVMAGEFSRGCGCANGDCRCGVKHDDATTRSKS